MRVYEAIVAGLEAVGVDAVFGGAGENAAGMMLALDESKTIRAIIAKNEQAAAFMACGYAMFSDRLGVCFATAGPGAFNLISGLCVALTDCYPLLAITGYSTVAWSGLRRPERNVGAQSHPEFADDLRRRQQSELSSSTDITDPVGLILQQAIDIAFDGRPGPVHIAMAEDITDPSLKVTNSASATRCQGRSRPTRRGIADCAGFLAEAMADGKQDRPFLPASARSAPARDREVLDFIERYQVPLRHHPGRQGHRRRKPSAGDRRLRRQRPQERAGSVPRLRRGDCPWQLLRPARDVRLPRRPVREQEARSHRCRSEADRQGLQGRPRDCRRRTARDLRSRRCARHRRPRAAEERFRAPDFDEQSVTG